MKEKLKEGLEVDFLELQAEIIEWQEKPHKPTGVLGSTPPEEIVEIDESLYEKTSFGAVLDDGIT